MYILKILRPLVTKFYLKNFGSASAISANVDKTSSPNLSSLVYIKKIEAFKRIYIKFSNYFDFFGSSTFFIINYLK